MLAMCIHLANAVINAMMLSLYVALYAVVVHFINNLLGSQNLYSLLIVKSNLLFMSECLVKPISVTVFYP